MKELLETAIRMLDQMHRELEELHNQLPWEELGRLRDQ